MRTTMTHRPDDGRQEGVPAADRPGVWVELERLAQADLRSVNAQIEFLLRDALARRGIVPKPPARHAGSRRPRTREEIAHARNPESFQPVPAADSPPDPAAAVANAQRHSDYVYLGMPLWSHRPRSRSRARRNARPRERCARASATWRPASSPSADLPAVYSPSADSPIGIVAIGGLAHRRSRAGRASPSAVAALGGGAVGWVGTWTDLGAGSGAFTFALRELIGPTASIYAVDKDRASLNQLAQGHRARFGDFPQNLKFLISGDFSRTLDLPALDGILMANALHFFRDKEKILRHVRSFLKPNGAFLLVEYNVDLGNPWVPYPLTFETFRTLAPRADFTEPRLLSRAPSRFLREFYPAVCYKNI